jgi:hypothetical protein
MIAYLKALSIVSWGWVVLAAVVAIVVVVSVPALPSTLTILFPGFGGHATSAYALRASDAATVFAIVVVVFAAIVLVLRLLVSADRSWILAVFMVVDILLTLATAAVLVSVLGQLGRTSPLGAGADDVQFLYPLVWISPVVVFVLVFASMIYLPRRMTLGTWRARR